MSSDNLKEKGNLFFSKGDYVNAIACYTEALSFQPQSHVILSNRSAAHAKMNMYQNAYDDAVACILLAPDFARGYLRKASALYGLMNYSESLLAAEEGYKLRGSDRICKDCIAQWVLASLAISNKELDDLHEFPTGVIPLTENCVKVLCEIQQKSNNHGGISIETYEKHLPMLMRELENVLNKFGHILSPCAYQWVHTLVHSLKLDPRTHLTHVATMESLNATSKELAEWFNLEVDHVLYPAIQSIIGLIVFDVLALVATLRHMLSFRSRIQILIKGCLVFYDNSILSDDKQYLGLHIHLLQELLNSFCMEVGHNKQRDKEEASEIKEIITKLNNLINDYDTSFADYADVQKSTELVIENASLLLPSDDRFFQMPTRLTDRDAAMLKNHVLKEVDKLNKMSNLHIRDMDSLVLATGGLVHTNEVDCAKMALKESENFYLSVIMRLLENKLLTLDDTAECFFHPQIMMICNAFFFIGIDDLLIANTVITWKCLSTELYALLARVGLSDCVMNVFSKIENYKTDNKDQSTFDSMLVELADCHKKQVDEVVQKWARNVINVLFKQSWEDIQAQLTPDQVLLQYCMCPQYDTDYYPVPIPPNVLRLTGIVIAISNNGPPIVKVIDFGQIQKLAVESHDSAMKAVNAKRAGRQWEELQMKADKVASSLLQAMFPIELQTLIFDVNSKVKRIFFCPDQILSKYPVEILPFTDGQRLGEKVAITYISSARELLRESVISVVMSSVAATSIKPNNDCVIFANPNFDMEKPEQSTNDSHWNLLKSVLSPFIKTVTEATVQKAHPLPESATEANDIEYLLSSIKVDGKSCPVHMFIGNDATMYKMLQVHSPRCLHVATHGFSSPDFHYQYHNFWSDTKSGLLLAGANTYRLKNYTAMADEAGTGELSALAACGMKLVGTRLVYLSTCRSSYGFIGRGEALSSLAQGFRIAGALSIIATLWPVSDEVGRKMAVHFYYYASQHGMCPSLALKAAKKKLREENCYKHWYNWAGFVCM
jgi:CHAT domain-containing protein/tetratricopeptide (TPR) repeat protein